MIWLKHFEREKRKRERKREREREREIKAGERDTKG
jgi:hypothetical protein